MEWNLILSTKQNRRSLGITAIMTAVFLLSFSDALVKLAGDRFGLGQIVALRSMIAAGLIGGVLVATTGPGALHPVRSAWVWARSLCLVAMWFSYYAALPTMSFALAAACYYTSPVWMAVMSRFVLGEPVGERGWLAITLSVIGVVLAVDPESGTLSPALLLPLAAAVFYALAGIITWSHCQDETAGAMALNLNICLCVVASVVIAVLALFAPTGLEGFVFSVWPDLGVRDWLLAAFLGGLLAIIATMVALAYRLAPTPVVGVFDTAYLGFAALWSILLFGENPTPREGLGIGMIATGAVLMSARQLRWPNK